MSESVLDRLVHVLGSAGDYDPNTASAPKALLWPDGEKQWEQIVPLLRERRRIISYGTFDPEARKGPAYWLRCVIASTIDLDWEANGDLIVYLPGVSRDGLRTLGSENTELSPLCALQHRCLWISHPNGKDWTVRSLLSNEAAGLGLDVASDSYTAAALVDSLPELVKQNWSRLEGRHVDAAFLHDLLNPDHVRSLLDWLDDPTEMRSLLSEAAWDAFVKQCKRDFEFDPTAQGEIEGARLLGGAEGQWQKAWQRFRGNPRDFPGIPARLRQAQPAELLPKNPGAWPDRAQDEEEKLRQELERLPMLAPQEAREQVLELEEAHKDRRGHVWADLGQTPLVLALEHLAELARQTSAGPTGQSVQDITEWYASKGWRADWAVLKALAEIDRLVGFAAVEAAISAMYTPWAENCARSFQSAVGPMVNAETYAASPPPKATPGDVVLFVDGLRFDVAHHLSDRLTAAGLESQLSPALAALPTVTQTAKPALLPVDQSLFGPGTALEARRAPDGPAAGARVLRGLLSEAGIQVLGSSEAGDPAGVAWAETGELDRRGHELGVRLAEEVEAEVRRIAARINELLDAEWSRVVVLTDHGWLLIPGGLPKNENLPVAVTDTKKGRCARVKEGADPLVPTVPWHWDQNVKIAVATGISCFEVNQVYEHGGVSPQECIVPRLVVSRGEAEKAACAVTSMRWRGLALDVEFTGMPEGAKADLRTSAGDAGSSIAQRANVTGEQGRAFFLVDDEDLEGERAHLVVVGADGSLLLQRETTVGQNR